MLSGTFIRWSPLVPVGIAVPLLMGMAAAVVLGAWILFRRGVGGRWTLVLSGIRLAIVGVFAMILFTPILDLPRRDRPRPELLILLDRSRSMTLPTDSDNVSRWQETTRAVASGPFADALRERFDLHWYAFDAAAKPIQGPSDAHPTGATTNLAASFETAWRHRQAVGGTPTRLLLVSDGVDHGADDPLTVARTLGLAIDVLTPSPGPIRDRIVLDDVQTSRRVLLGAETAFRLQLRRTGATNRDDLVNCTLKENGDVLWSKPLTLKAGVHEQRFLLTHRPEKPGRMVYEVAIESGAKDKSMAHRTVDVIDRHFEVLFLEDAWRWEFKYLHRLLQDDPALRATTFLARGGGAFEQFAPPDRRINLIGFPQNRSDLERFDVYVLGDVQPGRWPAGLGASLGRLVAEEGKSLVVIAGPNLSRLVDEPDLHAILPVELNAESGKPVEGPIDAIARPEASHSPFALRGVGKLPPLDRVYPALRRRPGATVVLEAAGKRNAFGNLILVAEQPVGAGRVLFIGTDTMWKWHTLAQGDGPTPYATFWQQAFRALTPLRSALGETQVWLTPERSEVEPNRPIRVTAEIDARRPLPPFSLRAHVTLPDATRLPLIFAVDPRDPNRYHATLASAAAGAHELSVQVVAGDGPIAEGTSTIRVNEGSEENDTHVDRANLARLAERSGGHVIDPKEEATWPVANESTSAPTHRPVNLWECFALLLLLTCFLAIDWFSRLFKGFV